MRMFTRAAALAVFPCGLALAQQGDGTDEQHRVSVFKPDKVAATPARIAALKAPSGFTVGTFADGLGNARILAVGPEGRVYISRREQGDVLMLHDADGDGRADGAPVVVAHRAGVHGLAIRDRRLYLATVKELFVADIRQNGTLGELTMLVGDLPDGGQHPNRTMAFGPDGMLYLSIGSSCNACNETNPEHATMLRVAPDGTMRTIFASGLRNTIGFDWHPQTGALWGMDHGIDFLGDDVQHEELNRLELGSKYGWPHVFDRDGINPQSTPPGGITKEEWQQQSVPMTLGYTAHAAPMQLVFYTGAMFPPDYRGDAFVTMRGSWNRKPASGYELVHIDYADGTPGRITSFVGSFLSDGGKTHFARPVGLVQAADGALLMGDDANGVVYRIAYDNGKTTARADTRSSAAPATEMLRQVKQGIGVPLALQRDETRAGDGIEVSSSSFAANAPIPQRHSEYADGVAPALRWNAVNGAKSYAIIMEDPDARPITPFVHWVAWNIPAGVTALPEGLQEELRLTEPEGLLQGRNSRGSVAYFGPQPPVGDPPHHYHVQIFALDRLLDVPAGADRDTVLAAMRGHVIAKGVLIGTFQQTVEPPK